jgi:hypothetical protein
MVGHEGKLAGNIARTDREIQMELKRPAKHNFSARAAFTGHLRRKAFLARARLPVPGLKLLYESHLNAFVAAK